MSGLTPYETQRLHKLAEKGGIKLDVALVREVKLSKKEIKKIECALAENKEPVVLVKKNGKVVRVFTHSGHAKLSKGMTEFHRKAGHNQKKTVVVSA